GADGLRLGVAEDVTVEVAAGGVVVETFFFGFARSWFSPKKPRSRTSTTPSPMLRLRVRRCAAAFFSASMRAWRPSFLRARFAAFDTYKTPNPWFNRAHASNGFQGTSARARVSGPGRQGYLSRRPAPPGRTLSPSPWPGWRIRRRCRRPSRVAAPAGLPARGAPSRRAGGRDR